jgi:hypothetical protein
MPRQRPEQDGYALLMAIFLVATVIIMATAITPSVLLEGRREREQEAIWRGNEYVRAIQLYYRKNGRYPQTVDDLSKGTLDVHFLRKAYVDPMNSADGSWRFIYVSPSGQLIGSVRYHTLQEMALMLKMPGAGQALSLTATNGQQGAPGQQNQNGQPGGPTGTSQQAGQQGTDASGGATPLPGTGQQAGSTDQSGTPGASPGAAQGQASQQGFGPTPGAFSSSFGAVPGGASGSGFGSTSATSGFGAPAISNVPLEAVDSPVLGAFLIGVASKVKKPSFAVYQGGKTYFEWEFIYNPLSVVSVGAPGTGTPAVTPPGPNGPAGTSPPPGFGGSPNTPNNLPLGLP